METLTLLDTNIVIEVLKNNTQTISQVKTVGLDHVAVSAITEMELYYGALNKRELRLIQKNINAFEILDMDSRITRHAVTLIETYAKSHGLQTPDAIIAATAICHKIPLLTYNLKDFRFIEKLRLL